MRPMITFASMLCISACVTIPPPVVSAFNGDSVNIQTAGLDPSSPPGVDDQALADATCKGPARPAGGRVIGDGRIEYLFLCS